MYSCIQYISIKLYVLWYNNDHPEVLNVSLYSSVFVCFNNNCCTLRYIMIRWQSQLMITTTHLSHPHAHNYN